MATIPIFSPTLPFLGLIPGGLSPGRMVRIKGIINSHGERCQIHLQAGAAVNPRDDVPLHISIRPNEHAIVRNSIQNQVVGAEERYGGCPIRYGESFDMLILAETLQYKIAINGVHFCTFAHRLPVHNARYISVSGGGVIYSIISEADVPGSVPVNPYPPPPIVQHPTPYAPPIGFVPNAPPSTLPPPPPYTPLPTHPIGGGGGHYPGVGIYPPPPPPPQQPGYPHHPPPGAHPPAVPFSPTSIGSSAGNEGNRIKMKGPLKQTLASGIQQTQDFLRSAIGDKKHHTAPPSVQTHPHSSGGQLGFVTMPPAGPRYGAPAYPTAPPPPSLNPPGYGPQHRNPQPGGFGTTAASSALAAGATAAIASKVLPVRSFVNVCLKGKPKSY
ncbi:galectin-9 isoform X2 [Anopheles stephensi]|uniref:galectin-9 isoform X2 n=1 Tax=Anopheles stephensi TaxID=30069 RepID=UPI00165882A7|nr:galectin-9 isoform X2 [Anopheles stephensi]